MGISDDLKVSAEMQRLGLALGFFSDAEVFAWVEQTILALEEAPAWLLDIVAHSSLAHRRDWGGLPEAPRGLAVLLAEAPGDTQVLSIVRALLGSLRASLAERSLGDVIAGLHHLMHTVDLPEPMPGEIRMLDHHLDMVAAGHATEEHLRCELAAFLEAYGGAQPTALSGDKDGAPLGSDRSPASE